MVYTHPVEVSTIREPEARRDSVQYVRTRLDATITARVTAADRGLVEAAAMARSATVSSWLAEAATRTARQQLVEPDHAGEATVDG